MSQRRRRGYFTARERREQVAAAARALFPGLLRDARAAGLPAEAAARMAWTRAEQLVAAEPI